MDDQSFRPMRIAMASHGMPKDVNYLDALDVLCSSLTDNEKAILQSWWFYDATERQKDVLVKLIADDAGISDQTYYPSVYTRRTTTWMMTGKTN